MNNKQKQELMKKIASLRTAEYISGFADGVQLHEIAIKQAKKANEILDKIIELINL